MGCPGETKLTGVDTDYFRYAHIAGVGLPSRHAASRCLSDVLPALEAIRGGRRPDLYSVVWSAGLDRSVLKELSLEVRTRNCLMAERLMEGDSPLTVRDILRVPNFGRKSLTDLLLATEDFLKECIRNGSAGSPQAARQTSGGTRGLGVATG